jgi:threonine dehydrogenase-like Zn-dependent dehydrogenase
VWRILRYEAVELQLPNVRTRLLLNAPPTGSEVRFDGSRSVSRENLQTHFTNVSKGRGVGGVSVTSMKRLKFAGNRRAFLEDVEVPSPQGEEVLVRVRASGLCGSDLHALYRPENGSIFTPGHEVAGDVVGVDAARHVREGDRVALYAAVGCGGCRFCRKGAPIMCPASSTMGFSRDGGDADYVLVPERACLPLPDSVSYEVGSLIGDGVGTPYRALMKAGGIRGGQTVGIFGLGPVGLGATLLSIHFGARVIGVDINPDRLALGRSLGAAETIDASDTDVPLRVRQLTKGCGADLSMECGGSDVTLGYALDSTRHFGRVAIVGEHRNAVATIDPSRQFLGRELTMTGTRYYHMSDYDAIVDLIESGLHPERIVTHRFALKEGTEAFTLFDAGRTAKTLIVG